MRNVDSYMINFADSVLPKDHMSESRVHVEAIEAREIPAPLSPLYKIGTACQTEAHVLPVRSNYLMITHWFSSSVIML